MTVSGSKVQGNSHTVTVYVSPSYKIYE